MCGLFTPTSPAQSLESQRKLLEHYVKSPFEIKSTVVLNYVIVRGQRENNTCDQTEKVLVLMHGFGLGLGFFYENFDTLATHFDTVIAVDWPGMGCSARTTKLTSSTKCGRDTASDITIAQTVTDELIDALETLRIELKIPSFTLAGHSLGGYLSGKYALKYPHVVNNLMLLSPVGIVHPPTPDNRMSSTDLNWKIRVLDQLWRWNYTPQGIVRFLGYFGPRIVKEHINRRFGNRWDGIELDLISDYLYHITAAPASGEYALNALLEPIFAKPQHHSNVNSNVNSKDSQVRSEENGNKSEENGPSEGEVTEETQLVEAQVLAAAGADINIDSYKNTISSNNSTVNISNTNNTNSATTNGTVNNANSTSTAPGPGGFEAQPRKSTLNPGSGVFARLPLETELSTLTVPILLVYGDHDWLRYSTAQDTVEKWIECGVPAAELCIIPSAGHHLYLDNSVVFNNALISWAKRF